MIPIETEYEYNNRITTPVKADMDKNVVCISLFNFYTNLPSL